MKRTLFLLTLLLIVVTNTWAEGSSQIGEFLYAVTDEANKKVELDGCMDQIVTNVDISATVMNNNERYSVTSIGQVV